MDLVRYMNTTISHKNMSNNKLDITTIYGSIVGKTIDNYFIHCNLSHKIYICTDNRSDEKYIFKLHNNQEEHSNEIAILNDIN